MPKTYEQLEKDCRRLWTERSAWREAYLALKAYHSNNNGPNAKRKRAATERLKDMKLK